MLAQYTLYTLPLSNGLLRTPEKLPKERSLLNCMIHKATSEAAAGKKVYLLSVDATEQTIVRRIQELRIDVPEFMRRNGSLKVCAPRMHPGAFDVPHWIYTDVEEGATVIIHGADMIFNSYAAARDALESVQEEKNCEIIFAWRAADRPAMPRPVSFEAWDELNGQPEKPIPVHTPFGCTKAEYHNNPRLWQDPLLIYCPAQEIAYKLDPEDPCDRRILDAFNSANKKA